MLSFQFFLLFSAFSSAQNLIAMIFDQEDQKGLGVYSLFVLYLVFGLASLVAPHFATSYPNLVP